MTRIFWKIFLGCWLTLVLTSIGVGVSVYLYNENRWAAARADITTSPRAEMAIIATAMALNQGGPFAVKQLFSNWPGERAAPVLIVDEKGQDLFGRHVPATALQHAITALTKDPHGSGSRRVHAPNGQSYVLFIPSRAPTAMQLRRHGIAVTNGFRFWHLQLLIGLFASFLLSAGLAWNFTRPVRKLQQATRQLAAGDLTTRVMPLIGQRKDEFGQLGHDFDHMAEQLQSLVNAQKRLLHDISHELRSPLSRMQIATTLISEYPEKTPDMLNKIDREISRLNGLIGEILTLSRIEAGVLTDNNYYIDIADFFEEIVADAQFEAAATERLITLKILTSGIINTNPELLRRALENILGNALKFTPPQTTVSIDVSKDIVNNKILITICDQGPGIEPAHLTNIFDPFFQIDQANKQQGYGLGLAIAKRSITALGGTIVATNASQGLCMQISLPAK